MKNSKKNDKIVRVKFSEDWTMLFGNSYKPWELQLGEYLFMLKQKGKLDRYLEATISDNPWVGWGGLKWCSESEFQNLLNREGCLLSEPDNPNPRKYSDMHFYRDSRLTRNVNRMFENLKVDIG